MNDLRCIVAAIAVALVTLLLPACEREADIDFDAIFKDAVGVRYERTEPHGELIEVATLEGDDAVERLRSALQSANREITSPPELAAIEYIIIRKEGVDDLRMKRHHHDGTLYLDLGERPDWITIEFNGDELDELHDWLKSMVAPVEHAGER